MKKLLLPMFFLFGIVQFSIGQETAMGVDNKNEVKFNALYAPGGYFELAYERTLGDKWAAGLAGGTQIIDSESGYYVDIVPRNKLVINPYFRHYFGKKLQSGFYLEANSIMTDGKRVFDGMGTALGLKVKLNNSWNLDFLAGGGYQLAEFNSKGDGDVIILSKSGDFIYQRLGIHLGYRF